MPELPPEPPVDEEMLVYGINTEGFVCSRCDGPVRAYAFWRLKDKQFKKWMEILCPECDKERVTPPPPPPPPPTVRITCTPCQKHLVLDCDSLPGIWEEDNEILLRARCPGCGELSFLTFAIHGEDPPSVAEWIDEDAVALGYAKERLGMLWASLAKVEWSAFYKGDVAEVEAVIQRHDARALCGLLDAKVEDDADEEEGAT